MYINKASLTRTLKHKHSKGPARQTPPASYHHQLCFSKCQLTPNEKNFLSLFKKGLHNAEQKINK